MRWTGSGTAPPAMAALMPRRAPTPRSGKSLGKNQLWWTFTKSTAIGSQITSAVLRQRRLALQDVSYAPDASTTSGDPITNGSTDVRNKWLELDYAGLADAVNKDVALQPTLFSDLITDKAGSRQAARSRPQGDRLHGSGRRRDPARRQHQLSRAGGGGDGRACRGAEVHADVFAAGRRRTPRKAGPTRSAARTIPCRCRNCRAMPTRRRRASRTSSSRRWWIGSRRAPRPAKSC